jgi:hypothetical protein
MVYAEWTNQRVVGFPASRFCRLKEASEPGFAEVRLVGVVAGRFQLPPSPN